MIASLITLVLGILIGTGGMYFGYKYTDKRRKGEKETERKKTFINMAVNMPKLITEMQADLINPEYSIIREFIVLPNKRVIYTSRENLLVYFEEQHKKLNHKISLLKNEGFIYENIYNNTRRYRMTEEFVSFVTNAKIKQGKILL